MDHRPHLLRRPRDGRSPRTQQHLASPRPQREQREPVHTCIRDLSEREARPRGAVQLRHGSQWEQRFDGVDLDWWWADGSAEFDTRRGESQVRFFCGLGLGVKGLIIINPL